MPSGFDGDITSYCCVWNPNVQLCAPCLKNSRRRRGAISGGEVDCIVGGSTYIEARALEDEDLTGRASAEDAR